MNKLFIKQPRAYRRKIAKEEWKKNRKQQGLKMNFQDFWHKYYVL